MSTQLPPFDEYLRQQAAKPWRRAILGGLGLVLAGLTTPLYTWECEPLSVFDVLFVLPFVVGVGYGAVLGLTRNPHPCASRWLIPWLSFAALLLGGFSLVGGWIVLVDPMVAAASSRLEILTLLFPPLIVPALLLGAKLTPDHRQQVQFTFVAGTLFALLAAAVATCGGYPLWLNGCWALGATMVMVGAVGEARVLTGRHWWSVLARLVTLRPTDAHQEPGTCPGCGYNLYGLADRRCPECGRSFTFEEIGVTPEQIGFVSTGKESIPRL